MVRNSSRIVQYMARAVCHRKTAILKITDPILFGQVLIELIPELDVEELLDYASRSPWPDAMLACLAERFRETPDRARFLLAIREVAEREEGRSPFSDEAIRACESGASESLPTDTTDASSANP